VRGDKKLNEATVGSVQVKLEDGDGINGNGGFWKYFILLKEL
jgi:hypothetical protein